jgi:hypothetical protein
LFTARARRSRHALHDRRLELLGEALEHRTHGLLVVDDQDACHRTIEATYAGSTSTGLQASANRR